MAGRMRDLALVGRVTAFGLTGLARDRSTLVFTVAFPVILLVLFVSIFGEDGASLPVRGASVPLDAYFTAGMAAYAVMMSGFATLAVTLTSQRETGQLKRLRATALPPWAFVTGQILKVIVLMAAISALLLAIGALAYGVPVDVPGLAGFAIYAVLAAAAFTALGVGATALFKTAESASTIAPFATVILGFISGVWIPTDQLPGWLVDLGLIFPLAHVAEGFQRTLSGEAGMGLDALNVVALAMWTVAGILLAARGFRWGPRGRAG
jgi:ABC-2 type transport system permease protein